MKNAYKGGAGIIIGYNGNPNLSDDIYDISQSPSTTFGVGNYKNIYPEIYNNTVKYLMGLQSITCMASYHEFQESHTPLEYEVQNPDVRIKIFNPYDDEYYQDFINEAINVLDSYKDKCNPKHQMLVSFSNDCKFDNKLLHGGYGCGSDSTWNKSNCIPVYCDTGYYYNKISNSCIKYPMDENDENDDKTLMVILIVVLVIYCIKKRKKNQINQEINNNIDKNGINFQNSANKTPYNRIQNTSGFNVGLNPNNLSMSEIKVQNLKDEIHNIINNNSGSRSSGKRKREKRNYIY